jgi:hypothetical protein
MPSFTSDPASMAREKALVYSLCVETDKYDVSLKAIGFGDNNSTTNQNFKGKRLGLSFTFAKDTANDICYGNKLRFLKGGDSEVELSTPSSSTSTDGDGSILIENRTFVGILFNLCKHCKAGPYGGFCFSSEKFPIDSDTSFDCEIFYLPVGLSMELDLKKGWLLGFDIEYDYTIYGAISMQTRTYNAERLEFNLSKSEGFKITSTCLKKITNKLNLEIVPFFKFVDLGVDKDKDKQLKFSGNSKEMGISLGLNF